MLTLVVLTKVSGLRIDERLTRRSIETCVGPVAVDNFLCTAKESFLFPVMAWALFPLDPHT